MAAITTYHASIPSLTAIIGDEAAGNLGLTHEIKVGEEVNYANSALAQEELHFLVAHHLKDPQTFSKDLVGKAQVRSSMVDNLHAKALFPEVAPPAATLEAIMEQLAAMRADFGNLRQEVGNIRQEMGNIRQEVVNIRQEVVNIRQELGDGLRDVRGEMALTNARTMNVMIRKGNKKRTSEDGLPPMPVHKVVAGSGIQKAQALCTGTGVQRRQLADIVAQIGEVPEYPEDMQHQDILQLIVFYNEDFGIERNMDLEARRKKMRQYLL